MSNNKVGDTGMNGHLVDISVENARFLLDSGLSFELVCRRLGIAPETLEKQMARRS